MPRPAFVATLRAPAVLALAAACGFGSTAALAQSQPTPGAPSIPFAGRAAITNPEVTYQYGHEFVTVTSPGNPQINGVFTGGLGPRLTGVVNEAYRISRFEVTTAQYAAFLNAAFASGTAATAFIPIPADFSWGARRIPRTPGTPAGPPQFTVLPGRENLPVGVGNWRAAAIYCNWLHNDMALSPAAFTSGSYDVSTFGYVGNQFTDQRNRSPGARFFLPTWNEWAKAAHWDPNRFGQGQGGYWNAPNGTDVQLTAGLPASMGGSGQANMDGFPGSNVVPLGAYVDQQSPWGLLDVAGARREWTETWDQGNPASTIYRVRDGSHAFFDEGSSSRFDDIRRYSVSWPEYGDSADSFRIAAAIPAPSALALIVVGVGIVGRRRR
jgi:formylglycine-generating enzyme required for sulfatase activity